MMVTTVLLVWAVIGPSVGLAFGAWWRAKVQDAPVRVHIRRAAARPALSQTPRTLGWR